MDVRALADWTSSLWPWIWGSVLTYALVTNALWLLGDRWSSPYRTWLVEVGRFLFYLAIPYLALGGWPQPPYRGLLSLEDMGLVGLGGRWPITRWLEAAGIGLGWGLVALLILVLAWLNANRHGDNLRLRFAARPWWLIAIDVLYMQVQWAFYRGALTVTLDNVYAGVFLGAGLIYLQWGLNPFWRQGWRLESRAAARWLRAALALVMTVLFFLTRNLWICLALHWLLELSLRQLGRMRDRHELPAALPPQTAEGA
jgi:hypothetical protein